MTIKPLLLLTLICFTTNIIFVMDNNKHKIRKKKDIIRLRDDGDKVKIINNGVSTGYMIKNKSARRSQNYISYSPEEKDTFLEACSYLENHMSPR